MTLHYDLYWSFRSPFSYLVTPRLLALEEEFDVRCNVRPVYPIAIRTPETIRRFDPLFGPYLRRDIVRLGEYLGMPIRWPVPDPVTMDMVTREIPDEQPYIHRLTRLGVAAAERGRGLQFLTEASRVIWSGQVDNWHQGDHLAGAAKRAGLDFAELGAAVDAEPERYDAIIEASQVAQRQGGHYGVPLMVFEGEPFFGQDRFDLLKWRLEQHGLKPRRA